MSSSTSLPNSLRPAALVTGASRGIGRAVAIGLAQAGHNVVVNYFRSEAEARNVVAEIETLGGAAIAVQADVANGADRLHLIEQTITRFGRLDVLVNNAGITSPGRVDLLEATEANWDTVFATNLKGPFFLAQLAARQMLAKHPVGNESAGVIVNISSISAYAVSTDRADYCLAKAALPMLTALFATRLADDNIRVYEVCPGVIASDMTSPVKEKYDRRIAEGLSPMKRWGQPEDVARAVTALVGNSFPFSTGDRINVDGGFHIRRL